MFFLISMIVSMISTYRKSEMIFLIIFAMIARNIIWLDLKRKNQPVFMKKINTFICAEFLRFDRVQWDLIGLKADIAHRLGYSREELFERGFAGFEVIYFGFIHFSCNKRRFILFLTCKFNNLENSSSSSSNESFQIMWIFGINFFLSKNWARKFQSRENLLWVVKGQNYPSGKRLRMKSQEI